MIVAARQMIVAACQKARAGITGKRKPIMHYYEFQLCESNA